jgi:hypothetical protein
MNMGTQIPVPRQAPPETDPVVEHINVWPGEKVSINTSDRNTNPVFMLTDVPKELADITHKFCAAWCAHLNGEKAEDIETAIVADFAATKAAIAERAEPIEDLKP